MKKYTADSFKTTDGQDLVLTKLDIGNYAGTAETLKTDIETRVVKVTGKSLVSDTEIAKLVNLDNTKDIDKPLSDDAINALALKLASGGYTGTAEDLRVLIINSTTGVTGSSVTPSSTPTGTGIASWIALEAGTYTNFGGVVVSSNSIAVISRNSANAFSISQTPLDLTNYVQKTDIVDGFASSETNKPGSAKNDKLLDEKNTALKSEIIDFGYIAEGTDLAKGTTWTDGFYLNIFGTPSASGSHSYSDFLPVIPGEYNYVGELGGYICICFYDKNKVFISGYDPLVTVTDIDITVPEGSSFTKITTKTALKATTSFKPNFTTNPIIDINSKIDIQSKNLYDCGIYSEGQDIVFDTAWTDGFYLNFYGVPQTASTYCLSDFIKIVDGEYTYFGDAQTNMSFCFYDINKVYIDAYRNTTPNTTVVFDIPFGAQYVKISTKIALKEGTTLKPNFNFNELSLISKDVSTNNDKIYVVTEDIHPSGNGILQPQRKQYIYSDHLYLDESPLLFDEVSDKKLITGVINDEGTIFNSGQLVFTVPKVLNLRKKNKISTYNFDLISTKTSVGLTKKIILGTLGDSQTAGVGAVNNKVGAFPYTYYGVCKNIFEKNRLIDANSAKLILTGTLVYNTVNEGGITFKEICEGRGGWSLEDYLYYSRHLEYNDATWAILGLGTVTGHGYTYNSANNILIATTAEWKNAPDNNATYIAAINSAYGASAITYAQALVVHEANLDNPQNPFYSKAKAVSSNLGFDFTVYLNRYKTLASDGVTRLVVGSTAGTKVTNVNDWDVCTPTHYHLQCGTNGIAAQGDMTTFNALMTTMIAELKSAVSGIIISFSIPDASGTNFPELYPNYYNSKMTNSIHTYTLNEFNSLKSLDSVASKTFLLPFNLIQPTAKGIPFKVIKAEDSSIGYEEEVGYLRQGINGAGTANHPGIYAHSEWGIQLYSFLIYSLSL